MSSQYMKNMFNSPLFGKSLAKLLCGGAALAFILFVKAAHSDFKLTVTPSCKCLCYTAAHRVTSKCKQLMCLP